MAARLQVPYEVAAKVEQLLGMAADDQEFGHWTAMVSPLTRAGIVILASLNAAARLIHTVSVSGRPKLRCTATADNSTAFAEREI